MCVITAASVLLCVTTVAVREVEGEFIYHLFAVYFDDECNLLSRLLFNRFGREVVILVDFECQREQLPQ